MHSKAGIEIEQVTGNSPASKAGLQPGDLLITLNDHPLRDCIDLMFYKTPDKLDIAFRRHGKTGVAQIVPGDGEELGITIKPFKVKTCRNNCIFCFVKQLPRGLRKSLYVKDEDYRLSFLYGNYITASNLDPKEKKRIVDQRLSPIYLSVHTTNKTLRNKMLGNPRASDIMKELKFFSDKKIRMHIQIVLCPGYNDGKELRNTIKDIYKFYPYAVSIAVVPVGLTEHRRHTLVPVEKNDALKAIETVESFQKRFMKKHGDPVVYCADELYIKADHPFPRLKDYGALPQIENGVGMVPLFMSQSKKLKIPPSISHKKKFLTFTGMSFYPFLKKFTDRLHEKENIHVNVVPVENRYFGPSITVTGLLTGRDVIKTLHDNTDSYEAVIVPDTTLKEDEDLFLDNVSLHDVEEAIGLTTIRAEDTPQGLIDAVAVIK